MNMERMTKGHDIPNGHDMTKGHDINEYDLALIWIMEKISDLAVVIIPGQTS